MSEVPVTYVTSGEEYDRIVAAHKAYDLARDRETAHHDGALGAAGRGRVRRGRWRTMMPEPVSDERPFSLPFADEQFSSRAEVRAWEKAAGTTVAEVLRARRADPTGGKRLADIEAWMRNDPEGFSDCGAAVTEELIAEVRRLRAVCRANHIDADTGQYIGGRYT